MNDISTRVIDDSTLKEESATPKTVGSNRVGESNPQRNKEHPCSEVHATEQSSSQDDDGNSREHKLEIDHGAERECLGETSRWEE